MAKKPKPARSGIPFRVYLPEELAEELEEFVKNSDPPTTKSGVLLAALRAYLKEKKGAKKTR